MSVIEIQDRNSLERALNQYKVCIVKVHAEWCQPCKALGPLYQQLAAEYQNSSVCFMSCHADLDLFQVTGLPSIIFFVNKRQVHLTLGADLPEIKSKLEEIYKTNGINLYSDGSVAKRNIAPSGLNQIQPQQQVKRNFVNNKGKSSGSYANYQNYGGVDTSAEMQKESSYLSQPNAVRNIKR